MEEKMVEEVNYDLLPVWISHEAVAEDEHKRDVRGEAAEGTNVVSVCSGPLELFFLCPFCPILNALLDLSFVLH